MKVLGDGQTYLQKEECRRKRRHDARATSLARDEGKCHGPSKRDKKEREP